MELIEDYIPEYDSFKELLVRMAQEPSVEKLLDLAVKSLARRPHMLLAQIWLVGPGDKCIHCENRKNCTDSTQCLHLTVGADFASDGSKGILSKKCGRIDRIPMDKPGIGQVAVTGKPFRKTDIQLDSSWIADNPWARGMKFVALGAQAMKHNDEILGVIAVYPKVRLGKNPEGNFWLRMIANFAGYAIANANAFKQIRKLKVQVEQENAYLREEISQVQAFGDIIGCSPPLRNILKQVDLVAPTDATVLILGESGTGKELIAREIHKRSLRSSKPMIKVNCATIPGELYESEFFGHVKGAFTGAVTERAGRFQAADGGTLFLDEVGEIPLNLQSKLLCVLQEGAYERIGEDKTRTVDVRIISATNRDIKTDVEHRRFREDLYYRLNVFPIEIAPLRHRKQDIPLLAKHFLSIASRKTVKPVPRLTAVNMQQLLDYDWPGNVRELQNVMERAVITSVNNRLTFDHRQFPVSVQPVDPQEAFLSEVKTREFVTETQMNDIIRGNIIAALKKCSWKIHGPDGAAVLLQIKPTTLASRMKRMNIQRP